METPLLQQRRAISLEELMPQLVRIQLILEHTRSLLGHLAVMEDVAGEERQTLSKDCVFTEVRSQLGQLHDRCKELGLPVTCEMIKPVFEAIGPIPMTRDVLFHKVTTIISVLEKELSTKVVIWLSNDSLQLLKLKYPFGEPVWRVFPDSIHDVEEARQCLAYERPTACAFHCMRVIDCGIKALIGVSFGDMTWLSTKENRTWLQLTRRIRQEAQKSDETIAEKWKSRQGKLDGLAEHLSLVAQASRNPVMHAEIRYNLEEATDVFNTVGAFMRRLSSELDQESTDAKEVKDTDNSTGRGNTNSSEEGRSSGLGDSGKAKAEAEIEVTPSPHEEEVGQTSSDHRSDGCNATHTRSDRIEDA